MSAAEAVVSSDVEVDDSGLAGHRFGYGTQRRSLVQRAVWTVLGTFPDTGCEVAESRLGKYMTIVSIAADR